MSDGPKNRYKQTERMNARLRAEHANDTKVWEGGFVKAFVTARAEKGLKPLVCSVCTKDIEPNTWADLHVDKEGKRSYRHHEPIELRLGETQDDIRARRRARNAERREERKDHGRISEV